jgi:hypothetical protein
MQQTTMIRQAQIYFATASSSALLLAALVATAVVVTLTASVRGLTLPRFDGLPLPSLSGASAEPSSTPPPDRAIAAHHGPRSRSGSRSVSLLGSSFTAPGLRPQRSRNAVRSEGRASSPHAAPHGSVAPHGSAAAAVPPAAAAAVGSATASPEATTAATPSAGDANVATEFEPSDPPATLPVDPPLPADPPTDGGENRDPAGPPAGSEEPGPGSAGEPVVRVADDLQVLAAGG